MIQEERANVVFVSDLLPARYPTLVDGLGHILAEHGILLRIIAGTRDLWCRDFMPVQTAPGEFVQFRYEPDYLRDGFEHLIMRPGDLEPIPEIESCATSDIIVDGGNVVGCESRCIMTEKVFRENPGLGKDEWARRLQKLLRVEHLLTIPKEPYDKVGHADGVLRFLDEKTVVINDYAEVDPFYRTRVLDRLRRSGLDWIEVPYRPDEGRRGEIPPAFGNYVNYLRVQGLVVLPRYSIPEDEHAREIVAERLSGCNVVALECAELSRGGGVLNCAAWTVALRPPRPSSPRSSAASTIRGADRGAGHRVP